ncbi:MAG: DNA-binding protein [Acidimicrobiia bacterium]|nr:DNA-binding protein [Acidimicrobiia bacterium]
MGDLPADWALPALTPFNEAWFTSGRLAVQRCAACATLQHPPEEPCHQCGGMEFTNEELAPRGTVHSYTVAHYAVNRALHDAVPYAVVLVSLDDAPHLRVVGNAPGVPIEEVRIGLPVTAYWEERVAEDGTVLRLPQWRPA